VSLFLFNIFSDLLAILLFLLTRPLICRSPAQRTPAVYNHK